METMHLSPKSSFPVCELSSSSFSNCGTVNRTFKVGVLVVGAGGLGCEILKNLVMSGFREIVVVDMDRVDVSNLNRQFLFREKDVGRYKAEVAVEYITSRFPHLDLDISYKIDPIEQLGVEFLEPFLLILGGLDNIPARRWLNSALYSLVRRDAETNEIDSLSVKFFLDGGSEGFKGQARVIVPYTTACFECTLSTFPPSTNSTYPLCTIAETPRLPEHCIEYVFTVQWDKSFPSLPFDADNPEHMQWVYSQSLERGNKFRISGVTMELTQGVVKKIVPAVSSTNALIAAVMVNEARKLVLCDSGTEILDNYYMYMGVDGVHAETIQYEKVSDCLVCGNGVNSNSSV